MNLLLDTHILLWALSNDSLIPWYNVPCILAV